jgi:hypothetical protein
MTPADALNLYRDMLADEGEDIEVRRYAGSGPARAISQRAIARGRVVGLGSEDIVGDIKLTDRNVILVNDPDASVAAGFVALWGLLPLTTADKLFSRNRELGILNVDDDTVRVAGVLVALKIIARG